MMQLHGTKNLFIFAFLLHPSQSLKKIKPKEKSNTAVKLINVVIFFI